MAGFALPYDLPADTVERAGCVADFLTEAIPAWAGRLDHAPPSDEAVTGLAAILHLLAVTQHNLAETLKP